MARDYTKYTAECLGENQSRRKLVFTEVKEWGNSLMKNQCLIQ